jgi:hypothetical protein
MKGTVMKENPSCSFGWHGIAGHFMDGVPILVDMVGSAIQMNFGPVDSLSKCQI